MDIYDISYYLTICALIVIYTFIPFIVADARRHSNKIAILVLSLFLGWTFIGWVAALVWALTDNVKKEPGV